MYAFSWRILDLFGLMVSPAVENTLSVGDAVGGWGLTVEHDIH